jgi:DNA sulfur modification protein DndD
VFNTKLGLKNHTKKDKTMVKNEYLRFLEALKAADVSSGVRKIANLILDHFDEILPLGTANGKRAKKIAELAPNNFEYLSDKIEETANEADNANKTITQIKSIKVGPFRGFAKEEVLNLYSLLVLIYGPNGTGKSSFCEALEYGLLGSVEEAQSKRFKNQQDYLKNAHVKSFTPPSIQGINSRNETVVVTPNEAQYRFCFVEKNRIDSFSRIAAHTPAKQTELISSLFGLDSFNSFVKNFSRELDERYIDLVGKKSVLLNQKQQSLDFHKQTINNNKQTLITQAENEAKLANQHKPDITFSQLVVALGTGENPGEIQSLEAELHKNQYSITGLTVTALEESKTKVYPINKEFIAKLDELDKASEELSFKQLYDAVIDLKGVSKDKCPACKTPLAQVMQNPYELAVSELEKLGHLATLEQERDQLKTEVINNINSVYRMLKTCIEYIDTDINPLKPFLVENEAKLDWSWWQALDPTSEEMTSSWWLLKDQVQKLEQRDAEVKKDNDEREIKQKRLANLRQLEKQVIKLQNERETLEEAIRKSKAAIEAFDEENKELIKDVELEKSVIATNQQITVSYRDFVNMLVAYNEELPSKLVADLGDLVVKLYNAFNRNDAPKDLLAAIKLPLAPSQRIEVAYQTEPEKFFDALHILSEGHIRCIGLAILLAKNIKTNSPLLIFDDPVNAIDDEHRKAIQETLFRDDYFKDKQIILACHGEEFFKNTHQIISKGAAKEAKSYIFKPQMGENHVQVHSLQRPKNYVLAATELFEQAEYRDALMSSRRALEYLCDKAWSHYGKHSNNTDELISISKRTPNAPWDLRNLAENLKSKIKRSKADIPNKAKIVSAFENLLGTNGQDSYWLYLNKGTHEEADREEFDHAIVCAIVKSIEQLDEALS